MGGFLNYGSVFKYASKKAQLVSMFKNVACLRLNTPQIACSASVKQKKKKLTECHSLLTQTQWKEILKLVFLKALEARNESG